MKKHTVDQVIKCTNKHKFVNKKVLFLVAQGIVGEEGSWDESLKILFLSSWIIKKCSKYHFRWLNFEGKKLEKSRFILQINACEMQTLPISVVLNQKQKLFWNEKEKAQISTKSGFCGKKAQSNENP